MDRAKHLVHHDPATPAPMINTGVDRLLADAVDHLHPDVKVMGGRRYRDEFVAARCTTPVRLWCPQVSRRVVVTFGSTGSGNCYRMILVTQSWLPQVNRGNRT